MSHEEVHDAKTKRAMEKRKVLVGLVAAAVIVMLLPLGVYRLSNSCKAPKSNWTGILEHTTKRTEETTSGSPPVKTPWETQSCKTLWDWLQLVGVPAALTIGGYLLNQREQRRAEERQREETLQTYLDRISELLIDKELGNQTLIKNPARYVARARTLTVLRSLAEDGPRKGAILRFLCEAELIRGNYPIISLQEADLRGADLRGAILFEAILAEARLDRADLDGANLRGANLSKASLLSADLRGARLDRADLQGADLGGADLKGATYNDAKKRPDGFKPDKAGMKEKD